MRKTKHKTPPPTAGEIAHLSEVVERAIDRFQGDLGDLESAIGMFALGRHYGWKVLYIIHSKKTIRKYEEILDIEVRVEFAEIGPDAMRSAGFQVLEKVSNFWKAISGGHSIPDRRLVN